MLGHSPSQWFVVKSNNHSTIVALRQPSSAAIHARFHFPELID